MVAGTVELKINNTWTDITSDVRGPNIDIFNRGRRNEQASSVYPSSCGLTLDNRTGKYSNRNPLSPYYGLLPRNTPLRVSVPTTTGNWAFLSGDQSGNRIETVDKAALDITGDIDIRVDVDLSDWYSDLAVTLAGKYLITGDQRSWLFNITSAGLLELMWSPDGTLPSRKTARSTVAIPRSSRIALRVTLDVNNGAGGYTANFYTGTVISGGTWTALGSPVTVTGTTSIFSGTANLVVGTLHDGGFLAADYYRFAGRFYGFQLRSVIAGTIKADVDFSTWSVDDISKADGFGNTWTMVSNARVQTDSIRFSGEVSTWPPKWDYTGKDIYVKLDASGILRRLGQGASPIRSPIYRNFLKYVPNAYWPLEDGSGATQAASAVPRGQAATTVDVTFANDDTLPGSAPVLKLNSATSKVLGAANQSVATGEVSLVCYARLGAVPAGKTPIITFYSTGTVKRWVISLGSLSIYLDGYDENNVAIIANVQGLGDLVQTEWMAFYISVIDAGADTNWVCNYHKVGGSGTIYTFGTNLLTNGRAGYFTRFAINGSADLVDAHFAHIFFSLEELKFVTADLVDSSNGYIGEAAATRIGRLCAEEGIPIDIVGFSPTSAAMGRQRTEKLIDLITAAANADMGILYEPRDNLGLAYRTRRSMYRPSGTTLDYSAKHLSGSLEPVEDDQNIRNDVTVNREGGSSARSELASGALSVLPPPNGVGRYDESVTIDVELDSQTKNVAEWRLSQGTIDSLRFPTLQVNLARSVFTANPTLTAQVVGTDVGDYLAVANLPSWLPQMTVETIAQGMSESLSQFEWKITWNATPADVFKVGTWNETSRYDTSNSTSADSFTSGTSTSLSVATAAGASLWVTGSGAPQFPFDIEVAGVRLTVTAIASGLVSDTFTRTVSSTWGTATSGQVWTTTGGSASDFSTNGTTAAQAQNSINALRNSLIDIGSISGTARVDVDIPVVPTGGAISVWVLLRALDLSNYYSANLTVATTGAVTVAIYQRVGGVLTNLIPGVSVGTHSAGNDWRIAFNVDGIGTANLRAKAWKTTDVEPGWHIETTDTGTLATGTGTNAGVLSRLETGNTNTLPVAMTFDNFTASGFQTFTVSASPVNGVVKAIPVGSQVKLWTPSRYGY